MSVNKVILIVPSYYSEFLVTEGYSTITNSEGIIDTHDIIRTMQACVYNKVPNNQEFIAVTPIEFRIDEDKKVKDPKGMKAEKYCKAVLSLAPKKYVYTAISLLENIGVSVIDINFGSVCDYFEFKNEEMDKKNTAVINIGEEKTEVSIFKKGISIIKGEGEQQHLSLFPQSASTLFFLTFSRGRFFPSSHSHHHQHNN